MTPNQFSVNRIAVDGEVGLDTVVAVLEFGDGDVYPLTFSQYADFELAMMQHTKALPDWLSTIHHNRGSR
jgi:hypothetical protein